MAGVCLCTDAATEVISQMISKTFQFGGTSLQPFSLRLCIAPFGTSIPSQAMRIHWSDMASAGSISHMQDDGAHLQLSRDLTKSAQSMSRSIFEAIEGLNPAEQDAVSIDATSAVAQNAEMSVDEVVSAMLEGIHHYLKQIVTEKRDRGLREIVMTMNEADYTAWAPSFMGLQAFFDARAFQDDPLFLTMDFITAPPSELAASDLERDMKIRFEDALYRQHDVEVYRVMTSAFLHQVLASRMAFAVFAEGGAKRLYLSQQRDVRRASAHGIIRQGRDLLHGLLPASQDALSVQKGMIWREAAGQYVLSDLSVNPYETVPSTSAFRESRRRLTAPARELLAFVQSFGIDARVAENEHRSIRLLAYR